MNWERSMRGARYHEAGHAVAAYHQGWNITSVTATAEEWRTNWRRAAFGGPADAWREACVTLAGQLADDVAVAAWGEMHPEPWEEFLEVAETVREMVEVYARRCTTKPTRTTTWCFWSTWRRWRRIGRTIAWRRATARS